jgi:hypothetical protein
MTLSAGTAKLQAMAIKTLKVALLQERDRGSVDANLDAIESGLREAAKAGAELVLLRNCTTDRTSASTNRWTNSTARNRSPVPPPRASASWPPD